MEKTFRPRKQPELGRKRSVCVCVCVCVCVQETSRTSLYPRGRVCKRQKWLTAQRWQECHWGLRTDVTWWQWEPLRISGEIRKAPEKDEVGTSDGFRWQLKSSSWGNMMAIIQAKERENMNYISDRMGKWRISCSVMSDSLRPHGL